VNLLFADSSTTIARPAGGCTEAKYVPTFFPFSTESAQYENATIPDNTDFANISEVQSGRIREWENMENGAGGTLTQRSR
jgi:hypothetical protein